MAFWKRDRARRADRAAGAHGRAPDPRKAFKANVEARRQAMFDDMDRQQRSIGDAAAVALRRLEAQGFPGAEQRPDSNRKMRAAWHLGRATANAPHSTTTVHDYYLLSTGEVVDERGGSSLACREPEKLVAAMNQLG